MVDVQLPIEVTEADGVKLSQLREFAEAHPVTVEVMMSVMAKVLPARGDIAEHAEMLDCGLRVVFTVERHPQYWMRHLSVSPADGFACVDVLPVLTRLGFSPWPELATNVVCYEEESPRFGDILNLVEPVWVDGEPVSELPEGFGHIET